MEEKSVITSTTAAALSGIIGFLEPLRWLALLGIVLILCDLRFGTRAAKHRGEKIRLSRAWRRTINKLVDYTCWIFIAGSLDNAIGVPFSFPLLPALTMLVVYGIEINSCFHNYFESIGKDVKVDFFSIFKKKIDIIEVKENGKI
jgi:uncharacterized membrane protein YfcA